MTIKLIAMDMDETLLRSDKTYDEDRFREVFAKLREKEVTVAIASGNSYPTLDAYFTHMNHDELYFASDNGNYVVKKGEVLHKETIDFTETLEIAKFLNDTEQFSVVICDGIDSYSTGIIPEYADTVAIYYPDVIIVDSLDEIENQEIVKMANHSPLPLDKLKEYVQEITDRHPDFAAVTSGLGWIDVFHKDGGKGSAIKALQKKYNVEPEETMVFGDSLNDASMMEHAKYSVAMSNADDELKEITNYIIGSNEEQAVLDVLEEFLETGTADFMEKYRKN